MAKITGKLPMQNTSLEDICAEIGFSATNRLAAWFGGRFVALPRDVDPGHPVFQVVGEAAFRRLVRAWGGKQVYVPLNAVFRRAMRDRFIAQGVAFGQSCSVLAGHLSLTRRRVEQLAVALTTSGLLDVARKTYAQKPRGKNEGKNMTEKWWLKDHNKNGGQKPGAKTPGKNRGQKPGAKTPGKNGVRNVV